MFYTKHGIKRIIEEPGTIENGPLFGLEYLILTKDPNEKKKMLSRLMNYAEKAWDKNGIYQNHIEPSVLKDQPRLSRDQIIFLLTFCTITGREDLIKKFWDKVNFGFYNGSMYKSDSDLYYWSVCGDKKLYSPLAFISYFSMLFSFAKKKQIRVRKTQDHEHIEIWIKRRETKTSGQILWFLKVYTIGLKRPNISYKIFKKTFEILCKWRFGSIENLFKIFYRENPKHPIFKVAHNAKLP